MILRRPRTGTRRMVATQADGDIQANSPTVIKVLSEEDDGGAASTERTSTADVVTAATPLSTVGMIAFFAYRTSKATTPPSAVPVAVMAEDIEP